jgi:hypothetical protein
MKTDQSGQVTVLVLGLALVTFAVAGLAVDGTRAFLLRRTLQNAADSSALAAAGELDRRGYYAGSGHETELDPGRARVMAVRWLTTRGIKAGFTIGAEPEGVRVRLRSRMPTSFLGLVGIRSVTVAVEAVAEPLAGAP